MKLYSIDKREIKNFHLRKNTIDIKNFFESQQSFGLFMMTDTLQPKERIIKRHDFLQHKLNAINLSKKTITFLTKNNKMLPLKNFLKGNVVLFTNKDTTPILNHESLTYLLNNKNFAPRFLYWNQTIYLKTDIFKLLEPNQYKKDTRHFSILMRKVNLNPLRINPFIKYLT